jgi:cell wall-associated NlpC family hydrolase
MTDGQKIATAALKWLGTPHVNMAKVRGRGVDCGMLLIASIEDAGLVGQDSIPIRPYSNMWHLSHAEEWFKHYVTQYCEEVQTLEVGDFLLYQYGRCVSHGGIYIGNGIICHAVVNQGVILSNINEVQFKDAKGQSRLRGIYRFNKELVNGSF